MDFQKVLSKLENSLKEILDSDITIQEEHVRETSSVLSQFAKLHISDAKVKPFLHNMLLYFIFLNKYSEQFRKLSAKQEFVIKGALETFLSVVDATLIYRQILKKFVKFVDIILENYVDNGSIKEFLRVYLYLLDKVSKNVVRKVVVKHQTCRVLYQIIKSTCDVETQAAIIELILTFYKYNNSSGLSETFSKLLSSVQVTAHDTVTIYQNIRMILDQLNEQSENIFSINCSTIEINSRRVLEFKGADRTHDIWLDFSLPQQKLSFFCDKNFPSSFNDLQFSRSVSWEVFSFSVKDMLSTMFEYDSLTKNLQISCKIKIYSFHLFQNVKSDSFMHLKISISRYSHRFKRLVNDVLPKLFRGTFSLASLNIPSEEDADSSTTSDIEIVENNEQDSSPVIEHFEKCLKKIFAKAENDDVVVTNGLNEGSSHGSVIIVSDDDDDDEEQLPETPIVLSKQQKISGSPFVRNYYDFYTDFNKFKKTDSNINSTIATESINKVNGNSEATESTKIGPLNKDNIVSVNPSTSHTKAPRQSKSVPEIQVATRTINKIQNDEGTKITQVDVANREETVCDNRSMSRSEVALGTKSVPEARAVAKSIVEKNDNAVNTENDDDIEVAEASETSNARRVSVLRNDATQFFNKSISPISFTESVFAKSPKSPSEVPPRSNMKISSFNKNVKGLKISSFKRTVRKTKISSSLFSSVINSRETIKNAEKKGLLSKRQSNGAKEIFEENVLDGAFDSSLREETVNSSLIKVKDWLNAVKTPSPLRGNFDGGQSHEMIQPVFTQNSERSSDLPPERRLEILMQEDPESAEKVPVFNNGKDQNSTTVEDLVHILESQEATASRESEERNPDESQSQVDDSDIMALSALKANLQTKANQNDNGNDQGSAQNQILTEAKELEGTNSVLKDNKTPNIDADKIVSSDVARKRLQELDEVMGEGNSGAQDQIEDNSSKNLGDNNNNVIAAFTSSTPTDVKNTAKEHLFFQSFEEDLPVKDNLDNSLKSSTSTKSNKRKLYNPEDLSYLDQIVTEEYLNSKEPIPQQFVDLEATSSAKKIKRERLKSHLSNKKSKDKKSSDSTQTKRKNNKDKVLRKQMKVVNRSPKTRKLKKEPVERDSTRIRKTLSISTKDSLKLTKSDIFRDVSKNSTRVKTQNNGVFTNVYHSLKEKIRAHEEQTKEKRRRLNVKRRKSSSSLESMEPFGVAVSNSRKDPTTKDDPGDLIRPVSEEIHDRVQDEADPNPKKINIISNILVQSASCQNQQHPQSCCCENMMKISTDFFVQSLQHVQRCTPQLLNEEKYEEIMRTLPDLFKK